MQGRHDASRVEASADTRMGTYLPMQAQEWVPILIPIPIHGPLRTPMPRTRRSHAFGCPATDSACPRITPIFYMRPHWVRIREHPRNKARPRAKGIRIGTARRESAKARSQERNESAIRQVRDWRPALPASAFHPLASRHSTHGRTCTQEKGTRGCRKERGAVLSKERGAAGKTCANIEHYRCAIQTPSPKEKAVDID
jgi:hypothetical protein